MSRAFAVDKATFLRNLRGVGQTVHRRVMHEGKKEGKQILKDIFGNVPPPRGKIPTAKLGERAQRFGFMQTLRDKAKQLKTRTKQALRNSVNRVAATLETRKLSRAYHQLIVMDQKRTMKEDLRQFVEDRWWIPQEFAVTHHHGLGSYVYLVSINIGLSVASFFVGGKVLSYANKFRKLTAFRRAKVALLRNRKVRRAAFAAGRWAKGKIQSKLEETGLIDKIDKAVQDTVESGAMRLFDAVEGIFAKTYKV